MPDERREMHPHQPPVPAPAPSPHVVPPSVAARPPGAMAAVVATVVLAPVVLVAAAIDAVAGWFRPGRRDPSAPRLSADDVSELRRRFAEVLVEERVSCGRAVRDTFVELSRHEVPVDRIEIGIFGTGTRLWFANGVGVVVARPDVRDVEELCQRLQEGDVHLWGTHTDALGSLLLFQTPSGLCSVRASSAGFDQPL